MKSLFKVVAMVIFVTCIVQRASLGADDANVIIKGEATVSKLAFSPDGRTLAVSYEQGKRGIDLLEVSTGNKIRKINSGGNFAISPDGKMLAADESEGIGLWDVSTGEKKNTIQADKANSSSMGRASSLDVCGFSHDSKILATTANYSGQTYGIILWDVTTGLKIKEFDNYAAATFSPDGGLLALWGNNTVITLLDAATGGRRGAFSGAQNRKMAFSTDGKLLASLAFYSFSRLSVVLWDVTTGNKTDTFVMAGEEAGVKSVTFSPDGKVMAMGGGAKGTIDIKDIATGQTIKTFSGSRTVAFSPDGKILATVSDYGLGKNIILRPWQTAKTYEEEEKEKKAEEEYKEETQRKKEIQEEKIKAEEAARQSLNKKHGLTGKLEKDLPKVAHLFRSGMNKARDWKYRIEHNTTSDKIKNENEKMLKWFNAEVIPLGTLLEKLAHQYEVKYGAEKLRDFAIRNNFLDVLEGR